MNLLGLLILQVHLWEFTSRGVFFFWEGGVGVHAMNLILCFLKKHTHPDWKWFLFGNLNWSSHNLYQGRNFEIRGMQWNFAPGIILAVTSKLYVFLSNNNKSNIKMTQESSKCTFRTIWLETGFRCWGEVGLVRSVLGCSLAWLLAERAVFA